MIVYLYMYVFLYLFYCPSINIFCSNAVLLKYVLNKLRGAYVQKQKRV